MTIRWSFGASVVFILLVCGCWAPTGREGMFGQWSTRGSGWAVQVDLSLSSDGQFDLVQTPLMMSKPVPTIYLSGTWNRRGNSLLLTATRRVAVGDKFMKDKLVDQFTNSVSISYQFAIGDGGRSILIDRVVDMPEPQGVRTPVPCRRVSNTPNPTDWPALERRVLGIGRDPGIGR